MFTILSALIFKFRKQVRPLIANTWHVNNTDIVYEIQTRYGVVTTALQNQFSALSAGHFFVMVTTVDGDQMIFPKFLSGKQNRRVQFRLRGQQLQLYELE